MANSGSTVGFALKTPRKTPGTKRRLVPDSPDRQPCRGAQFPATHVKTVLVIRPLPIGSSAAPALILDTELQRLVLTRLAADGMAVQHTFSRSHFDTVLHSEAPRADLHAQAVPLIEAIMEGRSAACIAYGQTGSGKTYQMEGCGLVDREDWGLIPFAVDELLRRIGQASAGSYLVTLSYVELYREQLTDLLAHPGRGPGSKPQPLQLKQNAEGNFEVDGLREEPIRDLEQVLHLIAAGNHRRHVAAHNMNTSSSRSFADVILKVESCAAGGSGGPVRCARLHLCDLAGSERQLQTGTQGVQLREAAFINSTLHVLRRVVAARLEQQRRAAHMRVQPGGAIPPEDHLIPFKESKLTKLLKESLCGNAVLLVLCCLSQAAQDHADTLGTLQFAQACKSLHATPEVRYVQNGQMAGLAAQVRGMGTAAAEAQLRDQQQRLRELQSSSQAQDAEFERARRMVNFLENELVCERLSAEGQRAHAANLALSFQRSVQQAVASTCSMISAYVGGAEVLGSVLKDSQLPHVQQILGSSDMLAQLDEHHLLRLVKAFLQVNYAAPADAGLAACMHSTFAALLEQPAAASCWKALVPFMLGELQDTALPEFVQANMVECLGIMSQAMTAGAAAQLDPPVVLSTMKSFLAAARPASPSAASPQGMSPVVACIAQLADSIACHSSACRGLAVLADVRAQAQQFAALAAAAELAQAEKKQQRRRYALRSQGPASSGSVGGTPAKQAHTRAMQRAAIIAHSHGNACWPATSPSTAISQQPSCNLGSREEECSDSFRKSPPGQQQLPSSPGGIQPDAGRRQLDSRSGGCHRSGQTASELQPTDCLGGGTLLPNGVTDRMAAASAAGSPAEAGAEAGSHAAGKRSVAAWAQPGAEVGQPETRVAAADTVPQPEHMDSPVMNLDAACSGPGADWLTPFRATQPASTQSPDTAWLACQQPLVACEPQVLSLGTGSEAAQADLGTPAAVAGQQRASSSQPGDLMERGAGSAAAAGGSIKRSAAAGDRQGLSAKGELAAHMPDMGLARGRTRSVLSPLQRSAEVTCRTQLAGAGRLHLQSMPSGKGLSRFAATQQDKENAVVQLKLEQALARVGPSPAPARAEQCSVGLRGPVSSTPTTSLPQLKSRLQGLSRGSRCDSPTRPGSSLRMPLAATPGIATTPFTLLRIPESQRMSDLRNKISMLK